MRDLVRARIIQNSFLLGKMFLAKKIKNLHRLSKRKRFWEISQILELDVQDTIFRFVKRDAIE